SPHLLKKAFFLCCRWCCGGVGNTCRRAGLLCFPVNRFVLSPAPLLTRCLPAQLPRRNTAVSSNCKLSKNSVLASL
ncbi:hypothetical protein Nmel_016670, partial [Mimus melanotis]